MEYRTLPHTGQQVSVIGLGGSSLGLATEEERQATIQLALESGVNYFDLAAGHANVFASYGRVMGERRKSSLYQLHFGADYTSGQYGWTLDPQAIRRSVEWQLEQLQTDYIDIGFIHCIDEPADLRRALKGGALDQIQELKRQGLVRAIGLSSHTPAVAGEMLDTGLLDVLMFSINPAYDYAKGQYGIGSVEERMALYRRCEKEGVGISVMKPLGAGQLLDGRLSPFGRALTTAQCLQYALDKPGVMTLLPGVKNRQELREILGFLQADATARDYSAIGSFTPQEAQGKCVYCSHCHPCPAGLDIALINKYYDLARVGDALAADHYKNLAKKAGDCIWCGHCTSRCPFGVDQMARMQQIRDYFGG